MSPLGLQGRERHGPHSGEQALQPGDQGIKQDPKGKKELGPWFQRQADCPLGPGECDLSCQGCRNLDPCGMKELQKGFSRKGS